MPTEASPLSVGDLAHAVGGVTAVGQRPRACQRRRRLHGQRPRACQRRHHRCRSATSGMPSEPPTIGLRPTQAPHPASGTWLSVFWTPAEAASSWLSHIEHAARGIDELGRPRPARRRTRTRRRLAETTRRRSHRSSRPATSGAPAEAPKMWAIPTARATGVIQRWAERRPCAIRAIQR